MAIRELTKEDPRLSLSEGVTLLDFYATWCAPCKALAPSLTKFAANTPEVSVVKIDIEQHPELTKQYEVRSVPTLVLVKDGKVVKTRIGGRVPGFTLEAFCSV